MEYLIFIHLLVVSGLLLSELFQWIFNQFLLQRCQKKRHGQCLGEKQISFLYTFLLYQASLVWTFIVNSQPIFVQKCQKKRYQVETWFLYTLLLYHSSSCLNFSSKKNQTNLCFKGVKGSLMDDTWFLFTLLLYQASSCLDFSQL